jgi:hypothetical protein
MNDADRLSFLVRKIVGKRLTYAELTGKTEGVHEQEEPFLKIAYHVVLSGRLDLPFWPPPVWVGKRLPLILRFSSHNLGLRNR